MGLTDDGGLMHSKCLTPSARDLYSTESAFCRGGNMVFASRSRWPLCAPAWVLLVAASFFISTAYAAEHVASETHADLAKAVETGVQKERSRQWLEAIEIYEDAVKHFPESPEAKYGL